MWNTELTPAHYFFNHGNDAKKMPHQQQLTGFSAGYGNKLTNLF